MGCLLLEFLFLCLPFSVLLHFPSFFFSRSLFLFLGAELLLFLFFLLLLGFCGRIFLSFLLAVSVPHVRDGLRHIHRVDLFLLFFVRLLLGLFNRSDPCLLGLLSPLDLQLSKPVGLFQLPQLFGLRRGSFLSLLELGGLPQLFVDLPLLLQLLFDLLLLLGEEEFLLFFYKCSELGVFLGEDNLLLLSFFGRLFFLLLSFNFSFGFFLCGQLFFSEPFLPFESHLFFLLFLLLLKLLFSELPLLLGGLELFQSDFLFL